uniref:Vacuolar protein sorting 13 homolog C n=1 Tax=Cyprinus carpio carpio TaxID=630221 RepID=A0A9J8CRL0_CYPCA
MVFESLVSDLLNRFIGDYVENLDKSQLKIGIWGGKRLFVKTVRLHQYKLILKIPWKNLYNEAVVATLDGLYLLVVPGATIKYDPVKEERYLQEAKQKELQRIEETLQLVARRGEEPLVRLYNDKWDGFTIYPLCLVLFLILGKPQEEKKDTFAEKLATQVIKNLQVKITSIHIRYEDDVSDPQRPLAMGMTLSELSLQTADENWKTCILNEAAKIIYKLGRLECFCAYWNVNSPIFYRGSWKEIVVISFFLPLQHAYLLFKPIFASARMCINPNAEVELKSPKANLHLEVQNIAIEMTKPQYLSMVDLLESIDCMVKNSPYRKFRPDVPVHRNTKQWWKYSINSILEVHIRRFNQMWNWNNIKKHRSTLKAYKAAYKIKLTQGKVREDTEKQIQFLSPQVVRSGQKLVAKKAATQKESGGGFFSSFFGKKEGKKKEEEEDKEPETGIDSIMTPEEKTKLYTAIGYSGSSHNLALPKHYVAVIVNFKLLSTSVTFREEPGVPEILKVQMIDLSTSISQRPGAQAIRVEAKLERWNVTGLQQQGLVPSLIASVGGSDSSLLSVLFELNPEDSTADQLLRVHSQPVEIIYDALTVISITEFFKTGKGVDLEVITSATLSKLEEIKEKTATGLSHIIETRKVLDLRIDLKPSYLLLPKSGFYDGKSDLMIVDFGYLQFNSVDQGSLQQVSASFSSLEEIMDRAYERFSLELRSVQILYSKSGEKWENARLKGVSRQHILQPMDFTLKLAKCMVDKDSRMPRFKVSGELPLLHVKISDQKIQGVLELVDSIPLPQSTSSSPSTPTEKVRKHKDTLQMKKKKQSICFDEDSLKSTLEELTEVQFQFEVKAVLLELTKQAAQEEVVLSLNVSQLGAEGKMRTFDLTVTSYLRKISLDYCEIKDAQNQPLHLITSSDKHGSDLLKVEYIKADVNGPSFHTLFNHTEQTLKVCLSLHMLQTVVFSRYVLFECFNWSVSVSLVSKGSKDSGVVNFKLSAVLGSFRVSVCDDRSNIADIRVQGIDASVVVQAKETDVFARLRDIVVLDVDPKTIHKKAVSIVGEEVFSFKMTLYPGATEGEGYTDTSKVDGRVILRLGCIQIVYLHKFLMSLLMFVDNFQAAKEALSAATAQAAEKAASSVRDFAQKSFRLAMNIRLKAPLIIIPQSSTSHNAFVVDLGLITVVNSFSLLPVEGRPLPAVLETMDVKLTSVLKRDAAHLDVEILKPINLELLLKRNLAATWYNKIPGMELNGVLMSMDMALGQEDIGVLMRILAENIGEGSRAATVEETKASAKSMKRFILSVNLSIKICLQGLHFTLFSSIDEAVDEGQIETLPVGTETQPALTNGAFTENVVNVLLNFEIKEVMLKLKKSKNGKECPFLVLHVAQLGIDTKVRKYDMEATTYIKTISMKCLEFPGPMNGDLNLNTEQKINVVFSSLDLMLHTEALLSTMDFLSAALSNSSLPSTERESKRTALSSPSDGDIIDLMVNMQLGAFNVLVCDQKSNMADIKIQGLDGSLQMQGTQMHMSTRLRDFIIMNVDPKTIHKKAISIMGDEVFSFSMSLTPKATEGAGYTDTSKVDGKVKLNVGCIQVVYLHKFVMSLLNFSNNFQAAKEAVSAATAQAAEKAASSVRDFAQKSFRLAMNIRLKAPLIIIPQSSTSHNAVEADLGLITVGNSFSLLPVEGRPLPAVIDNMDIQLTQLKLSRISVEQDSNQPSSKLLEPVNLVLSVKRNLAASWYKRMAAIEVDGDLKPMKVALSQDDLTVLLRILMENIGEASSVQSDTPIGSEAALKQESVLVRARTATGEGRRTHTQIFHIMIFLLVKNSVDVCMELTDSSCLGEFMLCKMKTLGKMFTNGNMEVSTILTTCTLDDRRSGIQRVTSRWMLGRRDEETSEPMIDMTYSQSADERSVVAVLQKLYLCASVEFLLAVADFFVQALPSTSNRTAKIMIVSHSSGNPGNVKEFEKCDFESPRTRLRAVVVDPEVVFVANLMKADAPALVASFQCDFSLLSEDTGQAMKANIRSLKVLACPFIRTEGDKAETTVCLLISTVFKSIFTTGITFDVYFVIVKISPIILNTVITITAAMAPKPKEEPSQQTSDDLNSLWSLMSVANANYWFLGVDTASEVTESFKDVDSSKDGECFEMKVKVVQVTLESGLGHRTVPLLLAESSFTGTAQNWSSLLSVSADMTLEVNYFNETHAVWEPLLERVDNGSRRWNLKLDMKNNPVRDKSPVPGDDFIMLPDPRTAITIFSKDTMNITVSKCCLSVFNNLAKAFSESTASTFDHSLKEKSPYTIRNALGIPLFVQHSANLHLAGSSTQGKLHELAVDKSVDLEHSSFERSSRLSALQRQESCLFNLSIVPSGYSEISNIPLSKPGRRLYNVRGPMQQDVVSVLLQIDASEGNKVITVRSPLQIKNHFSVPFAILKYSSELGGMVNIGVAEPEKECHVPLEAYRSQLFLLPVGPLEDVYGASTTCIAWKEQVHVSSEVHAVLQCPATESRFLPLVVNTLAVPDDLSHIGSHEEGDWDPAYIIHLHPAVTLKNLLPYSIRYLLEGSGDFYELQEGSAADVLNSNVGGEIMELVLIKYQGRNWTGHMRISKEMPEFLSISFTCDPPEGLTVDLCVHVSRVSGKMVLSVYSPYWIINKTSRVLQYRAEDTYVKHPSDFRDILVRNVLVVFHKFTFNKSSFELEVGEVQNNNGFSCKWHYISSTECLPLWPEASTGKLCVRVVGSESSSKSFFFNKQDNGTLLRMEKYGGVIVDVNIADHSTVISFTDYYDGAAPALVVNHTPAATVNFRQRSSWALRPGEAQRFAWDDPAGERKLCWSCQDYSGELDLVKDECGQFAYSSLVQIHWVSFLDGRQRVLIFTEDVGIVSKARQAEALEQFQQEVNISLKNLGLSLINNDIRQEIAYVGITSSGVVWEMRPKNRWKSFNNKNIGLLEKAYQDHINSKSEPGWIRLETGLEVNFGRLPMLMRQPLSCTIRRNFLPGIRIELKQSPHQRSLRAQLYWLQVDNQLPGAIFPTVFHPVPLPKSIVQDTEPKPFIDVSIITRFNEHSQVMQFKYFMALVQEMAVKIDQGFLGAILALFTPATDSQDSKERNKLIEKDLEALQAQLMESSMTDTSAMSFFEHFHISPIKLHLSLSLGSSGNESEQGDMVAIQSVNLLLKSIGATLTDVDDLIFKLAYFEVKYQFYRREKLMWTVIRHYSEQFLKQMYVLVLGLDVLGNPFGLIRGLSEGVEAFFYEPIQGAVQGPEEFAEGFVIGVRSLLGHTVGGAAGMVSRITGTVGKGLAAITMDKEYQQKRREEMNRPTKDFGESLAKGGKGFLKGVVGGVTGIVTKPVEGAKKEGAAGFFKGIGKGLVGVVARPTGGIIDMASSTFQGIQRVAESTDEVTKLRPVRLIQEDGIIRPYNQHESEGYDLFQIKQLDGEIFREHYVYPGHKKTNIIITNRYSNNRKMMKRWHFIDVIGHFNKEWECKFEYFQRPPSKEGGDLKIYYRVHKWFPFTCFLTAQLREGIDSAQFARKQYRMARQKSQRFIKMGNI